MIILFRKLDSFLKFQLRLQTNATMANTHCVTVLQVKTYLVQVNM